MEAEHRQSGRTPLSRSGQGPVRPEEVRRLVAVGGGGERGGGRGGRGGGMYNELTVGVKVAKATVAHCSALIDHKTQSLTVMRL